ncbi:MAG: ABC transporter ATP-binding protein [Flavobacteriaceae bacterium]|nr:ABC transporter ATP-binding protein [Rhodospirillaceae bacterium]MBT7243793.1 ABC transporter ATP-binding protein [Flavobacteriaceae bacterium]
MISISQLQKVFTVTDGKVAALSDLNIEVDPGDFFVIVGASGSGKTTLLRSVAGLERPDSGTIKIADRTVFSNQPATWVAPQDRALGMVFQSYAVWPHLTVFDNVALPLQEGTQKIPRNQVRARVQQALEMVQLEEQIDRPSTLLSGGQQQRVALARAIAVNPSVLLMDEPLSNLDARLREEVRGKIRDLAKQLEATVLYVTHDQIEAMAIADKIAVMSFGKLLQFGSPMDLYRNPNCPEVAEFFGTVNWLPGELESAESNLVKTAIGEFSVSPDSITGKNVWIGFRPEHMGFSEETFSEKPNHFLADLKNKIFLGDQYTFDAHAANSNLVGKSRIAPKLQGDKLHIAVDPADLMVFPADDNNTKFIETSMANA